MAYLHLGSDIHANGAGISTHGSRHSAHSGAGIPACGLAFQRTDIPLPTGGREGILLRFFHKPRLDRIEVDVSQSCMAVPRIFHMEAGLPERASPDIQARSLLEHPHDAGNGFGGRDFDQEMTVVGHDAKTIEGKGMKLLDTIESVDGFPGTGRFFKDGDPIVDIGGDEHQGFVLKIMSLEHGCIVVCVSRAGMPAPCFLFLLSLCYGCEKRQKGFSPPLERFNAGSLARP
ncbi:MAG: hypothetical protein PHW10_01985 [Candidatus Peribacteraceae bacterium]|nr:hypothetical protein [Candidatus Peribacteraceae bacterium]